MASFKMLGCPSITKITGGFSFQKHHVDRSSVLGVNFPGQSTMRSEFNYHADEFGRGVTIISPERRNRPIPSRKTGTLSDKQANRLYRVPKRGNNTAVRMNIAKTTTDPELLSHILENDPDKSVRAAAANNPLSPQAVRKLGCDFCTAEKWGEPRELIAGKKFGFASNPFRFAPYHDVHIAADSIHNLSEFVGDPAFAMDMIQLAFDRAFHVYREYANNIENIYWGMNYGIGRVEDGEETVSANASFQHIHAQLASLPKGVFGQGEQVALAMSTRTFKEDFFEAYIDALCNNELIIRTYENGVAKLVAPWSQESKNHMRIIVDTPNFIGDRKTSAPPVVVEAVGKAMYDALLCLFKFGVRSFNCTSFPAAIGLKKQKLVIDIIPRARPAFFEMSRVFVVDEYPTTTADEARRFLGT